MIRQKGVAVSPGNVAPDEEFARIGWRNDCRYYELFRLEQFWDGRPIVEFVEYHTQLAWSCSDFSSLLHERFGVGSAIRSSGRGRQIKPVIHAVILRAAALKRKPTARLATWTGVYPLYLDLPDFVEVDLVSGALELDGLG
jgi:hypothetical protein